MLAQGVFVFFVVPFFSEPFAKPTFEVGAQPD